MRSAIVLVPLFAAVAAVAACQKTGDGEYKVTTPGIDKKGDTLTIGTDTATVRTPEIDAGMKKDTLVVDRPTVDVKSPDERKGASAGS